MLEPSQGSRVRFPELTKLWELLWPRAGLGHDIPVATSWQPRLQTPQCEYQKKNTGLFQSTFNTFILITIIILLETNPNISTVRETQSSSQLGRGELSSWTGSTESLINIHQWESNNISLYRWRERGHSWTNVRPELTTSDLTSSISSGRCMMFVDCVWCWPCIAVWQMYVAVWWRETPLTDLCPDLSCLTASRVGLVVAWREENVFSLWLWLYKLWTASGWEVLGETCYLCLTLWWCMLWYSTCQDSVQTSYSWWGFDN